MASRQQQGKSTHNKLCLQLLLLATGLILLLSIAACNGQQPPQATRVTFQAAPTTQASPTSLPVATSTAAKEAPPTEIEHPTVALPSPYATAPRPTVPADSTWEEPTDFPTPVVITTPLQDLATLAQESDLIVRVRSTSVDIEMHTLVVNVEPQQWIKNTGGLITDNLKVWVLSGDTVNRPIPVELSADPTGDDNDTLNHDYVLFLQRYDGGDSREHDYSLSDEYASPSELKFSNAGVFSIENGKIAFAGIPKYAGWTVDDFTKEIHRYAPTPVPVSTPEYSLALQSQNASVIAEIQWRQAPTAVLPEPAGTSAPTVGPSGETRQIMQIVQVNSWIRGGYGNHAGLLLTQSEYSHLTSGGGHYILFLKAPDWTGDACSDSMVFLGYRQLQDGLNSIFEIQGGNIENANVPGYEAYTPDSFRQAINHYMPTPTAGVASSPARFALPTFKGDAQNAAIVAKVELGDGQTLPGGGTQNTDIIFHVQEWLKEPAGYAGNTISVSTSALGLYGCSFFLGKGPYIIFLDLDKNADPSHPERGPFYMGISEEEDLGLVFGINNGIVQNGTYIGEPIDKLESAIRASLQQPTSTPGQK